MSDLGDFNALLLSCFHLIFDLQKKDLRGSSAAGDMGQERAAEIVYPGWAAAAGTLLACCPPDG